MRYFAATATRRQCRLDDVIAPSYVDNTANAVCFRYIWRMMMLYVSA